MRKRLMQIYLVGGAVRDTLLNYPVYDRDWVVVGASAQEMLDLGYQPVGQDFPVFIHPDSGEEYALARTERKSGKGYTGFQYHADESVTLEQDLQRRDLTINAMAMDDQDQLFDPYNGQQDLNNKILRHVSPAFSEDPLRVLRVARFAARYHHLGFLIAPETLTLMTELAAGDELEHLTPERVWKEFERALSERSPHIFLEVLKQTQALNKVLPELDQSQATTSAGLLRFQQLCLHSDLTLVRFACLIALTPNIATAAFCDRLHTPKAYKELALNCQQHHQNLAHFDQQSAEDKLAMIQQLDLIRRPQRLELLLCCVDALHPQQLSTKSLAPILDEIASIQPKALIAEGHQGAALGEAIAARRLQICQNHSGNNSNP